MNKVPSKHTKRLQTKYDKHKANVLKYIRGDPAYTQEMIGQMSQELQTAYKNGTADGIEAAMNYFEDHYRGQQQKMNTDKIALDNAKRVKKGEFKEVKAGKGLGSDRYEVKWVGYGRKPKQPYLERNVVRSIQNKELKKLPKVDSFVKKEIKKFLRK